MPIYDDQNDPVWKAWLELVLHNQGQLSEELAAAKKEALEKIQRLKQKDVANDSNEEYLSADGLVSFPRPKEDLKEQEELAQMFDPSFDSDEEIDDDWVFNL